MANAREHIEVQPRETLGEALKHKRLWVDTNQRSYAWTAKQVQDLYEDFKQTVDSGTEAEHFLGSVIVTRDAGSKPKVVDGQQRLATTLILLAAMRDYFQNNGDPHRANIYEHTFLLTSDPDTLAQIAHLNLNGLDNEFFLNRVLLNPINSLRGTILSTRPSHNLILEAASIAAQTVETIASKSVEDLGKWRKFIEEGARVIWISVPDDNAAFVIFETMNDRGLQLSAADLLKNLLFALSGTRMKEVQEKWFGMVGILESMSDSPDIIVTYIRHLWVSTRSHVILKNLYTSIKLETRSMAKACAFAEDLNTNAAIYAALDNHSHERWTKYPESVRKSVETLKLLSGDQSKPLLLAIVAGMQKIEAERSLVMLCNWSVRFLISGGLGGGVVENRSGKAARAIRGIVSDGGKVIKTARGLYDELVDIIPSDVTFRTEFAKAKSARHDLSRYYLRSMELHMENTADWQLIPKDEPRVFNAEHIMPYNSRTKVVPPAWKHISAEEAKAYHNRIGNLALLLAKDNVKIGDKDFTLVKKPVFAKSAFKLTKDLAKYDKWTIALINERQEELAVRAVKTWPLQPRT